MSYDGDVNEVDTNILVAPSVYNEQLEIQEEAYLAKLQEAFPGDYDVPEPETEAETIPIAEAVVTVNEGSHTGAIIAIVAAIIVIIGVISGVIYFRKRK